MERKGLLDLLLWVHSFPLFIHAGVLMQTVLQTALLNILIAFPLSSVVTFHSIASLACQCASSLTILPDEYEWTQFLRFVLLCPITMTYNMERWTALHPPWRICHWIVLILPSSFMPFPGEARHTYFFRRKVSASRILQVPGTLLLGFFQKLFAVCASQ